MTWAAVGGAAVGVVGNYLTSQSGKSNGGAGTTTDTKAPWAAAQPWIASNLTQGQALQNQYQTQPFSPQQTAAYQNAYNQGDYMRSLVPSLLNQMQGQQVGYNPSNPTARPSAWNWDALAGSTPGVAGLNQQSVANAAPPPAPAATKTGDDLSSFINQTQGLNGQNTTPIAGMSFSGMSPALGAVQGAGGYGSWRYGMVPKAGTQQYADMSKYFALGGSDPNSYYGGTSATGGLNPSLWSSGLPVPPDRP
jgi:hypothetical protein